MVAKIPVVDISHGGYLMKEHSTAGQGVVHYAIAIVLIEDVFGRSEI
jgi:hypothetical protein